VLLPVAAVDGVQRLFIRIGIGVVVRAGDEVRRDGRALRVPGGYAAVGVAGHFGADRRQVFAQAGRLLRRNGRGGIVGCKDR
jgi:hypothetical protein